MLPENKLLQTEIERQEAEIEDLERIAASKQGEIARITQEYESAANDLKAGIHYADRRHTISKYTDIFL